MICNLIDKDFYIFKIYNEYINFDIYDTSEVKDFIYKIYDKLLKKNKLTGIILFDIYIDTNYGMIIEIKKIEDLLFNDIIDVKIKFNLNISFLYEVDYFYILENNLINQNIYYYKDKFYIEIINTIDKNKFTCLLYNSNIVYNNEINNIINNGIKLANIKHL